MQLKLCESRLVDASRQGRKALLASDGSTRKGLPLEEEEASGASLAGPLQLERGQWCYVIAPHDGTDTHDVRGISACLRRKSKLCTRFPSS